jgi:glyoxylase-like metal-dependent hydrolase (beta-lactamase superfamily II)
MPLARSFGPLSIVALDDGSGPFYQPRAEVFPAASAELWRRADAADPGAVTADGRWVLRFRCFAIRPERGPVVLVDAGIGPADAPAAGWAPVPGELPAELAAAGIGIDEIGTVVLTHLHTDHVGWAVVGAGQPYFPNARYLVQRADAEAVHEFNPTLAGRLLDPLKSTGQLALIDGRSTLLPGVQAVPTPGHTPGHQSVVLEAGGRRVLIGGDLVLHVAQLLDPELTYAHDLDPIRARTSRTKLLRGLVARGETVLAAAHLTEPFLPLPR